MYISYPATFQTEPTGGFCVQFVDLAEAFTEGETMEEAQFNAAEVLTLTLQGRIEEGLAIPEPSLNIAGAHYVAPDAKTQAVLLLRHAPSRLCSKSKRRDAATTSAMPDSNNSASCLVRIRKSDGRHVQSFVPSFY